MTISDTLHEHNKDKIDIVRELRLRRWARVHFVEEDARKPHWHPVVLDEMKRCDSELTSQTQVAPVNSTYVPVEPSTPHFISQESRTTDLELHQRTIYDLM